VTRIVAIVQARMGSTRFPEKVMRPIRGVPLIELLLARLRGAKRLNQVVLATSRDSRNARLVQHVRSIGYPIVEGSEDDVLDRYYQAATLHEADIVVRVTGDCPLVDPGLVDYVIDRFCQAQVDYASNTDPPTYPNGLDVEVFTRETLNRAWRESTRRHDREHVTPYMRESGAFRLLNVVHTEDVSQERWTVDEPEDLQVITGVFEYFAPDTDFTWHAVLDLCRSRPDLFQANRHLVRNEGAKLGTGQKLWKRAKRLIPGGSMLLSKRAEMLLPERWPAYFSRAKGCRVWDLDGQEYVDMGLMGVGTNILGYGHPEVDEAVRRVVDQGNMSTLNCPEEVYLAERLLELHPWAEMARFARSGGEANAIAVRLARAASARDKVAFCGYHGWHDWYLAANIGGEGNLAPHLLPGLAPNGVPRELRGSVLPFSYNRFDELERLVSEHQVGVIVMEVKRNVEPLGEFLQRVRRLATAKDIVLIFDECTSGFRQTLGGLHKLYDVEPDMAIFGKALGNGYAITAVIGRRQIMQWAQSTFVSSTFWTERIGPAAALKTLEVMERIRSYEQITAMGRHIGASWQQLARKHGLSLEVGGLWALANFSFAGGNNLAYKTLITQEMLKRGFLASNSIYVCTEHTRDVVDGYLESLDPVFGMIRSCEDGRPITDMLDGPICESGFKRLN